MEKPIATIAHRLRTALDASGKKQVDLVRETGLDRGAISSYLSGKYEPKQKAIYLMAKALNVSEAWLMGYDTPMVRAPKQKENDLLTTLVVKLRHDPDFLDTVAKLSELDAEQFKNVRGIISALHK